MNNGGGEGSPPQGSPSTGKSCDLMGLVRLDPRLRFLPSVYRREAGVRVLVGGRTEQTTRR